MKNQLILICFLFCSLTVLGQQSIGIGTTSPNASSLLDITSTTKGLLIPRMTYAQKNAISPPSTAAGLLVYQTNASGVHQSGLYYYNGTEWKRFARADETGGGGASGWTITGDDQYSNLTGNVGIGISAPTSKLHLIGNLHQENGTYTMNNPNGILQFRNAGVNKTYVQLSGNNLRLGTNSGNTGGDVRIRLDGTEHMIVDSNGHVGIGTMSPEAQLHVYGGTIKVERPGSIQGILYTPNVNFVISDENNKSGGLYFGRDGTELANIYYVNRTLGSSLFRFGISDPDAFDLAITEDARVGVNMNSVASSYEGQLHVRGASGVDEIALVKSVMGQSPTIQFHSTTSGGLPDAKEAFVQLSDGQDLRIGTNSGNTTGDLIMRLDGTDQVIVNNLGRMGIGTMSPIAKLHIEGGDDAEPNPFDGNGYITLGDVVGTNLILDNNEIMTRNGANHSPLLLQNDGGDLKVGSGNRLFVGNNGNVGIGTGSPLAKLDVMGRIRVEQSNEAIAMDGLNPYLSYWYNGVYHSKIQQLSNQLYINSNDKIHLDGDQIAIGDMLNTADSYKLSVTGKIICEELKVKLSNSWPDYVFANEYQLKPLPELKTFIEKNKHLPNIPKGIDVEREGFEVGEMNRKLLEKVEELTLYVISLQEQIDALKAKSN